MLLEFEGQNTQKKRILQAYLNILLYRCQHWAVRDQSTSQDKSPVLELFQLLHKNIEKNFRSMHKVSDYTNALHATARQLNLATQRYVGKTVAQLIQDRLVLEAKRLLKFSGKPIGTIATELSFEDVAHFSKFIKQNTGLPPSEWQKVSY
jgi:AraC-like DNA-binding protein